MITFLLVGAAAVAAAIGVIVARKPVHSVLWLIVHLCSLAVLYMTLQAQFLGLVQVLLYAGAVMVLFLFVLGLLSARRDAPAPHDQPSGQVFWGMVAAVVVAGVVIVAAVIGAAAPAAQSVPPDLGTVGAFGQALFGPYLLPFEATALALLSAIVAAVALSAGHDEHPAAAPEAEEPRAEPIDVSHAPHHERELVAGGDRR
jgi:NADH-quinone oxidoreductase subunit J